MFPLRVGHGECLSSDYETIIQMLQQGFGRAHYGTVLPFCFKLLSEMCDILCIDNYGIHWKNMNKTNYEEWDKKRYMDMFSQTAHL